jgi:hypothetical protein
MLRYKFSSLAKQNRIGATSPMYEAMKHSASDQRHGGSCLNYLESIKLRVHVTRWRSRHEFSIHAWNLLLLLQSLAGPAVAVLHTRGDQQHWPLPWYIFSVNRELRKRVRALCCECERVHQQVAAGQSGSAARFQEAAGLRDAWHEGRRRSHLCGRRRRPAQHR